MRTSANLFDLCARRRLVFVAAPEARAIPDPGGAGRFHYAGLAGSGMSALAQFQAMTGGKVSGSDRAFDRGERGGLRAQLESLGIAVLPQDGSGLGADCAALVVSTAVEDTVPDVATAKRAECPSSIAQSCWRISWRASLDRRDRDQRQVDGGGDDL